MFGDFEGQETSQFRLGIYLEGGKLSILREMKGTACTKASGESPREPQRRYLGLDGLRGAAILLVVADHYKIVPYLGGVVLFFVLSGFLLGGILMSKRGAPNYYKAFYARRACRILPLYLLSVLAFFSVLASLPRSWPFGAPPRRTLRCSATALVVPSVRSEP